VINLSQIRDKDLARLIISKLTRGLQNLANELQDDEIVTWAVAYDPFNILYASDRLKYDKNLIKASPRKEFLYHYILAAKILNNVVPNPG
jgi:chemotaxis regulatin CheY-phosphate phosphatase CheZ